MTNQPKMGVRSHARFRFRSVIAATGTVLALAATAIPLGAASAAADTGSAWGDGSAVTAPATRWATTSHRRACRPPQTG